MGAVPGWGNMALAVCYTLCIGPLHLPSALGLPPLLFSLCTCGWWHCCRRRFRSSRRFSAAVADAFAVDVVGVVSGVVVVDVAAAAASAATPDGANKNIYIVGSPYSRRLADIYSKSCFDKRAA